MKNAPGIDIGLAILAARRKPRTPIPAGLIAAFCGCTRQRIDQLTEIALRKAYFAMSPADREELRESLQPGKYQSV